jgi:cytochrome d ubiquinol oxidase subunit II
MDLSILWFILIAVLYIGFFLLEGFDFGVGILLPFLGKDDTKRRVIINTIGPHWDGNEVWLLTAGGATFAAFPNWYATLFSGFYLALFLLLLALIVRGVALEFRSKDDNPRWRALWDWCIFIGSLVPALLLGVVFANLLRGVPINANQQYVGSFFDLLNPFALLGGVASLLTFTLYGALFLTLKTTGELLTAAQNGARRIWPFAALALLIYFGSMYWATDIVSRLGVNPGVVPIAMIAVILAAGWFIRQKRTGWAFILTALTILLSNTTIFLVLFPRVMVSSLDPAWSLTIHNASSSPYTLTVMTVIALFFTPIVLLYQGWTYWVFRQRIQAKPDGLTY